MWQDSVVEKNRNLRKQYAEKFNNDIDAILADIRKRQEQSKHKLVYFPARVSQLWPRKIPNKALYQTSQ